MNKRLKDVVGKLYHPPNNGRRQVIAVSRELAERLPCLPNVAIVSITAPERKLAVLGEFDYVLRLSFSDVDFLNTNLPSRAKNRLNQAFTIEQAELICTFVQQLPELVCSIVIHCEGGYSRSCAVAMGLHQLFGYTTEVERLKEANPSVVKLFAKLKMHKQNS